MAGQKRMRELEAEWWKAQDADGRRIVGTSVATRRLVDTLNVLLLSTARPDTPPILVVGESGTGKELVVADIRPLLAPFISGVTNGR
jgi:transcriptional regulator with GAF, ATPase, and Fis domain